MDREKLRALAVSANSAGCIFAESDGSLESEECCAWEIADEAMHDSLTPEVLLDLLDALEAADVKNTLLSACLHKAEEERDRLREDAKRLDWLNNASEMGLVEFGFEMDGGVFMRNSEAGGPEVDFRERNSVREAIDAARKPA